MPRPRRPLTGKLQWCIKCRKNKDTSLFTFEKNKKNGLQSWCLDCLKPKSCAYYLANRERLVKQQREYARMHKKEQQERKRNNPNKYLWIVAKSRAKKKDIKFTIKPEDIVIPKLCPVLGIRLRFSSTGKSRDNSPTVDKFIPNKGYTPDNISVISKKANVIKNNASIEELTLLVKWMRKRTNVEFQNAERKIYVGVVIPSHANPKTYLTMFFTEKKEQQWRFAGGKVEEGEILVEAAIRETEEELDIHPTKLISIGSWTHFVDGNNWTGHYFLIPEYQGIPRLVESKHSEIRYLSLHDLIRYNADPAFRVVAALESGKTLTNFSLGE